MELEYKGANTVLIKQGTAATVVINPKLSVFGLKDSKVADVIELAQESEYVVDGGQKILIQGPGEYEVSDVSIKGIATKKYGDPEGKVTIYKVDIGGVRCAFLGNTQANLDENILESIGVVDIVAIPVGGGGVTLNAHEAAKLVNQIDPKIVIPMHYKDTSVKYAAEQDALEDFLKELGAQEHEVVDKLKIKGGVLPAIRTVFEVKRT